MPLISDFHDAIKFYKTRALSLVFVLVGKFYGATRFRSPTKKWRKRYRKIKKGTIFVVKSGAQIKAFSWKNEGKFPLLLSSRKKTSHTCEIWHDFIGTGEAKKKSIWVNTEFPFSNICHFLHAQRFSVDFLPPNRVFFGSINHSHSIFIIHRHLHFSPIHYGASFAMSSTSSENLNFKAKDFFNV